MFIQLMQFPFIKIQCLSLVPLFKFVSLNFSFHHKLSLFSCLLNHECKFPLPPLGVIFFQIFLCFKSPTSWLSFSKEFTEIVLPWLLAKLHRKNQVKKATLIGIELNCMHNDENAQSFSKKGKAATHFYMLSRAAARKRRSKGMNHVFISSIHGKKRLSSNHERIKEAGQVNFRDMLFMLDA